ncbi:hypothetical protein [Legionella spiritensis]|uniref:hypothetical protein n=1 Tax=Legionella spiritensis TaxID=452 RepID=UPI000F6E3288|nr:hypothetical protein [Legionella spiritensis]VEG90381.1 Uncharacterised protein [Legionella spiritensis]
MPTHEEIRQEEERKKNLEKERDILIRQELRGKELTSQQLMKDEAKKIRDEKQQTKADKAWAEVERIAKDLQSPGTASYAVELYTAFMKMWEGAELLNKAVHASAGAGPTAWLLKKIFVGGPTAMASFINRKIEDKAGKIISDTAPGSFEYDLHFNEDGSFDLDGPRYDGEDISDESKERFKAGIMIWADLRGYKPNNETPPKLLSKEGNEPLTQEKFQELNTDGDLDINTFLGKRFTMPNIASPSLQR